MLCFDGTINSINSKSDNIIFIKKNISNINNELYTNLHDLIDNHNSIFLKMDIEGYEIQWIKSLSEEQLNKFDQIVIEFHTPFSTNEIEVFEKINKNHLLVHFHPNNCCGTRNHHGVIIPNIFECTYINKKFVKEKILNTESIPGILDYKNVLDRDEIFIIHPPFVN